MKLFKIFLLVMILASLCLCAYPVLHEDIGYNTDVGRDLLILQNIVSTHKLPLIGPHSGLGGVFHGPLWPYINLPAFILGNGNPIAIGWFWVFLVACSVFITYFVGKKIFNDYVGLLSALILAILSITYSDSLLNPFGAVIFSPLFFYFLYKYVKTLKVMYLGMAFFTVGILIQFEIVFGGPMLILSLILVTLLVLKKKKLKHLLSVFILVIPLSTYILFELRHNFLQLRSIIAQAGASTGSGKMAWSAVFQNRFNGFLDAILAIPNVPWLLTLAVILVFIYIGFKCLRDKKIQYREFYLLFIYFYLGYWPLTFYLRGQVMGYHILPFLPVALIILISSYRFIRKEILLVLLVFILLFDSLAAKNALDAFSSGTGVSTGSWKFSHQIAQALFKTTPSQFGYFSFTADEFGYSPRYVMIYTNKEYPKITSFDSVKKPVTYVIMAPTEDGVNNNRQWWIKNKVRINKEPENVINYTNGYEIEKFALTNEEVKIPPDPNLLSGLFFR